MRSPVINILNAHWMQLKYVTPEQLKACKKALLLPTADGQGWETLFDTDHCFPNRLYRKVTAAIQGCGAMPVLVWKCPRPSVMKQQGNLMDLYPEMVQSFGLRGHYQPEAIRELLTFMGGILNSAAGSGKTRMAAYTIRLFMEAFKNKTGCPPTILWVAQTREQVDQAIDALKFAGIPSTARFLKVSCWQGLENTEQGEHFIQNADILVMDECHSATDSLYSIASKCVNAWWRIGLTATKVRTDNRELIIEAMFGQKVVKIDQLRVQSEGHLLKGHAVIYPVGEKNDLIINVEKSAAVELQKLENRNCSQEYFEKQKKQILYRHARNVGILNSQRRNQLIISIAHDQIDQGKRILIIVGSKEQGRFLKDRIAGSKLVYSNMPVSEGRRDDIMTAAREVKIQCIIATSLADQGLDIPCLDVIIMAAGGRGGKDGYLVEQRAARGQRISKGKSVGTVIDFEDHGYDVLKFHSYSRINKYKQMRFTMEHKALESAV